MVRLGQHNESFCSLINVFGRIFNILMVLVMFLVFYGVIFGSMIYWLERGEWRYTHLVEPHDFAFVRTSSDGLTEELSPFVSIPGAMWWFIVTATTTGYGDVYPTTPGGKLVACTTMLLGVLVLAFPVSMFSDLFSRELKIFAIHNESYNDSIYPNTDDMTSMVDKSDDRQAINSLPKVIATTGPMISKSGRLDVSEHSLDFFRRGEGGGEGGRKGVITMDDMETIKYQMKAIHEAQETIQMILSRLESPKNSPTD